jgi:hypothetical protein
VVAVSFSQIIIYELSTPKQLYQLQFSCVISKTAGQYICVQCKI